VLVVPIIFGLYKGKIFSLSVYQFGRVWMDLQVFDVQMAAGGISVPNGKQP